MSELNNGAKAWHIVYNNTSSSSSNTSTMYEVNKEGPWKSSMDAISFGFVATAILISMFLIMAIFEHLFRPNESSPTTEIYKLNGPLQPQLVETTSSYASVVMPGEDQPRFIGQPAPLPLSCAREGVHWPSHLINLPS